MMSFSGKTGSADNRILNVSPGRINGTNFYNGANNLSLLYPLADEIIYHMNNRNDLFIPEYEEVFKKVLERYHRDFRAEGEHSYEYKQEQLKYDCLYHFSLIPHSRFL